MSAPGAALLGVILAVITLALLLPVRRPQQRDTLDAMVGSAAMDAYLRQELSAATYADLPAPVSNKYLDGGKQLGQDGEPVKAGNLPGRTVHALNGEQVRPAGEHPIYRWARIFRIEEEAKRARAVLDAWCDARDAARHEAKMAGIAARTAEPFPHLDRRWQDDTDGFPRFVEEQRTWFTGTGSFAGATS